MTKSSKEIQSAFDDIFSDIDDIIVNERWKKARKRHPKLSKKELRELILKECNEEWDRKFDIENEEYELRVSVFGERFEKFVEDLAAILRAGYNPTKVTTMYIELTFVFETEQEANLAYEQLEKKEGAVVGWWYGEEMFSDTKEKYEKEMSDIYESPYRIVVIDITDELKKKILDFTS